MGKEVVFQKWRWTEINVTLGLIFVALLRKEWPMTFIAVRCPHCQSDQIVKRGKTALGTQRGGVSNVDRDGNNALQIKAIGVVISTFETLPRLAAGRMHHNLHGRGPVRGDDEAPCPHPLSQSPAPW